MLLDQGIKEREDGERGGGGIYFKYFHQRPGGDYSREAINRGTAISKEIRYVRAGTPELLDMSTSSKLLCRLV